MNKLARGIAVTGVLACGPTMALAQNKVEEPGGDKAIGVQVLVGGVVQTSGTRKSDSFHRIIYKGNMLSQHGEQSKNSEDTHQFFSNGNADTNDLFFDLVQGAGKVKNDVLNGYGIDKIPLPHLLGHSFRNILRGGASLDGKAGNLAFGFEPHSWHPVTGLANWIIPGINAERQWAKGSKPATTGTLTYRAFLGKGMWGQKKQAPFTFDDVLNHASTREKIRAYRKPDFTSTGNHDLDIFLRDQSRASFVDDAASDYIAKLRQAYNDEVPGFRLGLTDALWVESDGWWDFVGREHPRVKTMVSVIWSVFRDMRPAVHTQFQIRYETGFDRTQPDRINRVIGALGFTF